MIYAIVAAGGLGRRFQSSVPKQLLPLKGRPVLGWTLKTLQREPRIDAIFLTYPKDDPDCEQRYREVINQEKTTKVRMIAGGEERYDSVRNAFQAIGAAEASDLVLIHDAARPLLSASLLRRLMDEGAREGACIPVMPVQETLKEVEQEKIMRTIPRHNMYLAQTPQVFRYDILKASYDTVPLTASITDEAILVEKAGYSVVTVPGERQNIKITEPADLNLAEYYLSQGCE